MGQNRGATREVVLQGVAEGTVEKRRVRGDLLTLYNALKGGCGEVSIGFFCIASRDRPRRNGLRLQQGRLGLDTRRSSFPERVVRHGDRLESPSLEEMPRRHGTSGHGLMALLVLGRWFCLTTLEISSSQNDSMTCKPLRGIHTLRQRDAPQAGNQCKSSSITPNPGQCSSQEKALPTQTSQPSHS